MPTTPGAYDTGTPGGCSFATKLNQSGTGLVYSTRLGVMCNASEIDVDSAGNAYLLQIAGESDFFKPAVTPGAYDEKPNGYDTYVFKLNSAGTAQMYGSYLGGSDNDFPSALAAADAGAVVIVGQTLSTDFPVDGRLPQTRLRRRHRRRFVDEAADLRRLSAPKGATPLRLSLVIAYKPRSCSPPGAAARTALRLLLLPAPDGVDKRHGRHRRLQRQARTHEGVSQLQVDPATRPRRPTKPIEDRLLPRRRVHRDHARGLPVPAAQPLHGAHDGSQQRELRDGDHAGLPVPAVCECAPTADDLEGSTCSPQPPSSRLSARARSSRASRAVWRIDNVRVFDSARTATRALWATTRCSPGPGFFVP